MPGGRIFRDSPDSYANTGIPCGNPRRFNSHDVVRMETGQKLAPQQRRPLDGPVEDIETEGQRQLKALLHKQLNTDVSLQQHFSQRKEFTRGADVRPSVDELSGQHSLLDHQVQERTDRYIEEMKGYGLTLEEILYKLQSEEGSELSKKSRLSNPEFHAAKLQEINEKIEAKKQNLKAPDAFSGGKTLTRHEMELEKTLAKSSNTNSFLHKVLVHTTDTADSGDSNNPMRELPELLDKVTGKTCHRHRHGKRKHKRDAYKSSCTLECCVASDTASQSNCPPELANDTHSPLGSDPTLSIQTCAEKPVNYVTTTEEGCDKNLDTKSKKTVATVSTSFMVPTVQLSNPCNISIIDDHNHDSRSTDVRELSETVAAIPEEVIKQYKLSEDEVRSLPRFQNYHPGEPSNVLYIKNLSPKVTEVDLASLFIRYQTEDSKRIVFKLLSGRMKGQAFITFDSITTATKALELVHGYEFKGKPVIIQYGKQSTVS